jgi:hypothetical protein
VIPFHSAALMHQKRQALPVPRLESAVKKEHGDSALYTKVKGGGLKRKAKVDDSDDEFDWGNTNNCEGVCYRCGRPQHIAQYCIADMPDDVKKYNLNHSVNVASFNDNDGLFAFSVDHRHDKPASLAHAFSDLALSDFTLNSISTNTSTITTAQSIVNSPIAMPKKRKKKSGAKKSELVKFTF